MIKLAIKLEVKVEVELEVKDKRGSILLPLFGCGVDPDELGLVQFDF
jgi:hypothetical protein